MKTRMNIDLALLIRSIFQSNPCIIAMTIKMEDQNRQFML
jgi:hypothetical protein